MRQLEDIKNICFIGIGGIGMSALARYCREQALVVSGFDKTESPLTRALEREGVRVFYEADPARLDAAAGLVVYTPAVGEDHVLLRWYREKGTPVIKRADLLQMITRPLRTIAIAGTHGKTTISSMLAHILRDSGQGVNAFLGGIANNYNTNFWSDPNPLAVVEADEYDRSFLKLSPFIAVVSAMDPDHLDIFGTADEMVKAFSEFTARISPEGMLWYKHGIKASAALDAPDVRTYSLQNDAADVFAENIRIADGGYRFDVRGKDWMLQDIRLQLGGMHNVENAVVAVAIARALEVDPELIRDAVGSFTGVRRRFEYVLKQPGLVYIDDYAHHPEELRSLIKSAQVLFPEMRCVVAFQPHLYSRTRDFAAGFAAALDLADEVLLLDIYPAREQPIPGVGSEIIRSAMGNPNCTLLDQNGLLEYVRRAPLELFITAGAGSIGDLTDALKFILLNRDVTINNQP